MNSAFVCKRSILLTGSALMLLFALSAQGQTEVHGRKYKALQPAANITVKVEKATNGKPISNAAVIFHASRDGKQQGNMEVKTNPEGDAKVDIIEVGSRVSVQIIADGYATSATEFDVTAATKNVVIKMERPRAQVSVYENNDGKASQRPAGIQEPPPMIKMKKKPATTYAPTVAPAMVDPSAATSSPK